MNESRARELVAGERARIQAALRDLTGDVRDAGSLERQQTGEGYEVGTDLQMEGVDMALITDLRQQLAAVGRAEERLAAGAYGRSVVSGAPGRASGGGPARRTDDRRAARLRGEPRLSVQSSHE